MDYKEAICRIADHQQVHHMKEQPRCQKITEALSLAIKALEQYGKFSTLVDEFRVVQIECNSPSQNEIISIRFSPNDSSLEFIRAAFESSRDKPNRNSIVLLPKDMDLQRMRTEELVQLRAQINDLLEVVEEGMIFDEG